MRISLPAVGPSFCAVGQRPGPRKAFGTWSLLLSLDGGFQQCFKPSRKAKWVLNIPPRGAHCMAKTCRNPPYKPPYSWYSWLNRTMTYMNWQFNGEFRVVYSSFLLTSARLCKALQALLCHPPWIPKSCMHSIGWSWGMAIMAMWVCLILVSSIMCIKCANENTNWWDRLAPIFRRSNSLKTSLMNCLGYTPFGLGPLRRHTDSDSPFGPIGNDSFWFCSWLCWTWL